MKIIKKMYVKLLIKCLPFIVPNDVSIVMNTEINKNGCILYCKQHGFIHKTNGYGVDGTKYFTQLEKSKGSNFYVN